MEDDLPRPSASGQSDAAARLSYESLDRYSQSELMQRIDLLEAEIVRVRAHHARAADHRSLADALFSPPPASIPGDGDHG